MWMDAFTDLHQAMKGVAFDVVFGARIPAKQAMKILDVARTNMPLVRAPSAPVSSARVARRTISGRPLDRVFRSVAILFTFTESFVMAASL